MITCTLNGRLGNQMYQIAATIATALKNKVPYSIPLNTLNDWFPVYFTHLPEGNLPKKITSLHETGNAYGPIEYTGGALKLNGYFQSYKYFEDHKEEVFEALGLYYDPDRSKGVVSIHVRRGDYLNLPDFPVLGLYYYHLAIDYFRSKNFFTFQVFSDDMPWCKQNISSRIFTNCKFQYSENRTEKQDMEYMSMCEHNIVANSTFSIWAAMLNQNPNKIVIAPMQLFKNANKDMIPTNWIRLTND